MAKRRERKKRRQEQRITRPEPQQRYQQRRRYEEDTPKPEEVIDELYEEPKRGRQKILVRDTRFNRIRPIMEELDGTESPDELMNIILEVLEETDSAPIPGKFYTFIYYARTPGILYDVHPLIATDYVSEAGFRGLNFHWGKLRNYVWDGVLSPFHVVYKEELRDLESLPYQKFKMS